MAHRNREEQRQIRTAAENLLGSSSSHHELPSNESSLNTVLSEVIPHADIVTGVRPGGRMSVVRRFFCLFVTFDLLFTILMWLISNMLISADVFKTMSDQIVHYSIRTSLFDIVMAAAARFVVLLLFYGLLYIEHWIIVALSTAGTCSFLIAKVFLYNWLSANSPVLQVLLIITSFVISWGEAWFLDFRVIPHEVLARDIFRGKSTAPDERSPLLAPYIQGLPPRHDDHPESERIFYSPMDSLAGSDDEEQDEIPPQEVENLRRRAHDMLQVAITGLVSGDWRLEKQTINGDIVESRSRPNGGRVYRMQAEVEIAPQRLLRLLFNELESFPVWNPTLSLAQRLQVLDEHTDISYQVMADTRGGLVTARDFVTLRRWETDGCSYTLASVSVVHSAAPPKTRPIRAEQGPSCWVLEPGKDLQHTHLRWLLDTDLRGWIPQALIDQAFASSMLQWLSHLRTYAAVLKVRSSCSQFSLPSTSSNVL